MIGRDHGVGADGKAADFDHAHGGAANLRKRSIKNQAATLQQAESVEKKPYSGAEADCAKDQQSAGVGRTMEHCNENHRWNPGRLGAHLPYGQASEWQVETQLTLVMAWCIRWNCATVKAEGPIFPGGHFHMRLRACPG